MTIFKVGEYVEVDATEASTLATPIAFIEAISEEDDCCSICYVIEMRVETNVSFHRLRPSHLFATVRRQRGQSTQAAQPSLLAPRTINEVPVIQQDAQNEREETQQTQQHSLKNVLYDAAKWNTRNAKGPENHPLYKFLSDNSQKEKGWLRKAEYKYENGSLGDYNEKANLKQKEKHKLLLMKLTLASLAIGTEDLLADAWGINSRTTRRVMKNVFLRDNMQTKPKKRTDSGETIFNSQKKRQQYFTGYSNFKRSKNMTKRHAFDENAMSVDEIKEEWAQMDEEQRRPYLLAAEAELHRAAYLENHIARILQKTQGSITWRQIQSQLADSNGNPPIISYQTIRRHIMGLKGSCYKTNRFKPSLSKAQIKK